MEFLISFISGITIFLIVSNFLSADSHLDSNTEKRLLDIKNKAYNSSNSEKLKRNIKFILQDSEYRIKFLGTILNRIKLTQKLKKMIKLADVDITVDTFIIMSLALGLPFFAISVLIPANAWLLWIIGLIITIIPLITLKLKIKKRLQTFTQQFPDALGLISSSLRAGHSLTASFQIVAQEMPAPINKLFRIVVDDISLGRDTKEALDDMTSNMPGSMDLRFFITAVVIQREIGGNLAEILDSLGDTIRDRFKLLGQLDAQTAQAKLSGMILSVAPAAIGLVIWFMNPKYMEPLFTTMVGKMALGGSILSAIVGFFVIMKITDIKV